MSNFTQHFDVIVVGGGHAGTEAALAAARMQSKTLLLTQSIDTIGQMSCNPTIGGIGKGHLVREVDAMGGAMGQAIDVSGIQFRVLNSSKGAAVQSTRAQADRVLYKAAIKKIVEEQPNLTLFQHPVTGLLIDGRSVTGVKAGDINFTADTVVLTVGTFLAGKIHIGSSNFAGGRAGDPASIALAESMRSLEFRVGRLKTGTPPRIDGRSINYEKLEEQAGDVEDLRFSFWPSAEAKPRQVSCYIANTTEETHQIIRDSLANSPLYNGTIDGVGPRYCPSIEDKVVRFAEKKSHQIFVEPEGLTTYEVYPNGISTSLPFKDQVRFVRSIPGFEQAQLTRAGYAIEYDYFDPRDLNPWLESRILDNLFFAGQINGTTGYEEAAAQGLLAGLNAALKSQGKPSWYPLRSEAYLGVLVDDLVTRGTAEPYRMFTSRAEYRLSLREDNADERLSPKAYALGLLSASQYKSFEIKQKAIQQERANLKAISVKPESKLAENLSKSFNIKIQKDTNILELLKRPEVSYPRLVATFKEVPSLPEVWGRSLEVGLKYEGYIARQKLEIAKLAKNETLLIPRGISYKTISGLSAEIVEKLTNVMPATLGQAARIPGVTPAAISLLRVTLKARARESL